jgi:hypothetical protein
VLFSVPSGDLKGVSEGVVWIEKNNRPARKNSNDVISDVTFANIIDHWEKFKI